MDQKQKTKRKVKPIKVIRRASTKRDSPPNNEIDIMNSATSNVVKMVKELKKQRSLQVDVDEKINNTRKLKSPTLVLLDEKIENGSTQENSFGNILTNLRG